MNTDLIKVVDDLKQFVNNHLILRQFISNDLTINSENNIKYPMLAMTYGDIDITDGVIDMDATLYFLDRLDQDKSNRVQIMSDMIRCAVDVKSYFRDTASELGWWIDADASIVDSGIIDVNSDETTGKALQCTIKIQYQTNMVALPIQ